MEKGRTDKQTNKQGFINLQTLPADTLLEPRPPYLPGSIKLTSIMRHAVRFRVFCLGDTTRGGTAEREGKGWRPDSPCNLLHCVFLRLNAPQNKEG